MDTDSPLSVLAGFLCPLKHHLLQFQVIQLPREGGAWDQFVMSSYRVRAPGAAVVREHHVLLMMSVYSVGEPGLLTTGVAHSGH